MRGQPDSAGARSGMSLRDRAAGRAAALVDHPAPRQQIALPVLLVDDDGCAEILGVSKRTLTSLIPEPWMPAPIALGPRLRRWSVDELRSAISNMPRGSREAQPEGLLRARIERQKATGEAA